MVRIFEQYKAEFGYDEPERCCTQESGLTRTYCATTRPYAPRNH
jgi:hypothetical protein